MKNLRNEKGITLVALVVTIIVLLILAGVSLSLVAGSDGILTRASTAADTHQIAAIQERVEMKIAEEVEAYYEAKYVDRTIDNDNTALQYLSENETSEGTSEDVDVDGNNDRKKIEEGGTVYTITYNPADIGSTTETATITVKYSNGKTVLTGGTAATGEKKVTELSGEINQNGSIKWNKTEK